MNNIRIDHPLPNLVCTTDNGEIQLHDYVGSLLVIYFYPKDNTPGCTTESKDFRDLYSQFQNLNAEILGVSRDSVKSHQSFRAKFELPFALISDSDSLLCNTFDVIKPKKMYGKECIGIERSTFLFDSQGRLVREWRKVKVNGHAQEVLDSIQALDRS